MDIPAARAKLQEQIHRRHARTALAAQSDEAAPCEHDWQRFRETIHPERTSLQSMSDMEYKMGAAFFVTMACLKCKTKRRQELVVEQ